MNEIIESFRHDWGPKEWVHALAGVAIIMDFPVRFNPATACMTSQSVLYVAPIHRTAMAEEEPKSFVIRDRRSRADQTDEPAAGSPSPSSPPQDTPRPASPEPAHDHESHPPVTFSSFIFSLGTSALMLMGEQLDPQQGRMPVNLSQAKEIIDILSMLEGKTKGNLTADEQTVLTDMLYALRMKYVDLASGKPTIKSP